MVPEQIKTVGEAVMLNLFRFLFGPSARALPVAAAKPPVCCATVPIVKKAALAAQKPRPAPRRIDKTMAIHPVKTPARTAQKAAEKARKREEDDDTAMQAVLAAGAVVALDSFLTTPDSSPDYSGGGGDFGGGGASGDWGGSDSSSSDSSNDAGNY